MLSSLDSNLDICGKNKIQALLLALHKLRLSEEQKKSAISTYEPLVTFALSCGMYSSPAVLPKPVLCFYINGVLGK